MSKTQTLITSTDDKGRHAVRLFEIAYDKSKLDGDRAQRLNERPGEFQEGVINLIRELTQSNQFADEEVRSDYAYPSKYKGPKPIEDQIKEIAKIFDLDPTSALEYAKILTELPDGAEGWFAIPSVEALAKKHFSEVTDFAEKYCRALILILGKIEESRNFYNYREGQIDTAHLKVSTRTLEAIKKIVEIQKGDILIVAVQLGMRHRGRSVRRAREIFITSEAGITSVMTGSIALTHPERYSESNELDTDCAGDEWSFEAGGVFGKSPCLYFSGGVRFGSSDVDGADEHFGSGSFFLPQ